ncbi:MAG TPA: hypothetical protein VGL35_12260 [Rhizomicrobium sp.]|jgi:hydrogenase maturation protease
MTAEGIRAVADAVLYEGYILYPYRKSALKNRQRWTFGGLFPRNYAERGVGDRWFLECECLLRGNVSTQIGVNVRFLQVVNREIGRLKAPPVDEPELSWPANAGHPDETRSATAKKERTANDKQPSPRCHLGGPHSRAVTGFEEFSLETVPELTIAGRKYVGWDEAMEREVTLAPTPLAAITAEAIKVPISLASFRTTEPIADDAGRVAGRIIRRGEALEGRAALRATRVADDVFRLTLRVENLGTISDEQCANRHNALPFTFASTHAILSVEGGEFLSLIDPPENVAEIARACRNDGLWPVLAGAEGKGEAMLAAPIILYDYPQIAPESAGDLFDGTEIDEILILRTLTMTDAEKAEMAAGDTRARALLERIEAMSPQELGRLHGAWRSVQGAPQLASVGYGRLAVGDRVKLKPRAGGDIMDIVLKDKTAVIEGIERDFEDRVHVAVVLDDDPGREFGLERMPGHRFFFSPEEIEIVSAEGAR